MIWIPLFGEAPKGKVDLWVKDDSLPNGGDRFPNMEFREGDAKQPSDWSGDMLDLSDMSYGLDDVTHYMFIAGPEPLPEPTEEPEEVEDEYSPAGLSEALTEVRAELLLKVQQDRLLKDDATTVFTIGFSGYGDSGDVDELSGDDQIDAFLQAVMKEHVHFDWYNNDGGGGDITWDITKDEILINGYQNETISNSIMAEFEV
jgi:hypothetical protein